MPLVSSGVEHGNLRELALARMKDLGTQVRNRFFPFIVELHQPPPRAFRVTIAKRERLVTSAFPFSLARPLFFQQSDVWVRGRNCIQSVSISCFSPLLMNFLKSQL